MSNFTMPAAETQQFWDKKILQWETDKYSVNNAVPFSIDVNSSLKSRMNLARSILKRIAPGRTILELGCGSGQLAENSILSGAEKYVGIDISSVAIQTANQKLQNSAVKSKIEFKTESASKMPLVQADICFSLGLLDWLNPGEIQNLQKNVKCDFYFHTFSEKRMYSVSQLLHRSYVFLKYGYKNVGYVPKYYTAAEITNLLKQELLPPPKFFRRPDLSFGCVAYHLPCEIENLK